MQSQITAYPKAERIAPDILDAIFTHTKGIVLSQVCELSHLESTTIQNWVKRFLVPPPKHKLYDCSSVARILIVDLLRDCLPLESISFLLTCINGQLLDISDDVITETELYRILYHLIGNIDGAFSNDPRLIDVLITEHGPKFEDEIVQQRVDSSLRTMLLAYCSVRLKSLAKAHLAELQNELKNEIGES